MAHFPQRTFSEKPLKEFHVPLSLCHCAKFKKNYESGSRVMIVYNFGPIMAQLP